MDHPPSLVITFDEPLEWNGKSVSELELREPKAGEVLKCQQELNNTPGSQWKFGMALIGAVSGHPRQIIDQMPVSKMLEAINYLTSFLSDDGQETGPISSSL
jgi:hypothetical protein